MRRVMKRAWEIVRNLVGDLRAKLSVALKQAWSEFKNVKKEIVKRFDKNGNLDAEFEVNEVGEKDGFYKSYINGEIFVEGQFENGKRVGIWRQYTFDVKGFKEVMYIDGKKVK